MTAPRPAEGPASRSGVRRSGDAYQDLVVWGAAMRVIGPGSRFTQVEVEVNGVGNVDDVILRSTAGDRFGQVKWATTTASQVDEDFLTSSSGNEKSLLQKLHRSYGALRTAGGTPTLELITNRTLDGAHPLLGHVDGRTDLLVPYATLAGPKTEAGKAFQAWADHVGVSRDDLRGHTLRYKQGKQLWSTDALKAPIAAPQAPLTTVSTGTDLAVAVGVAVDPTTAVLGYIQAAALPIDHLLTILPAQGADDQAVASARQAVTYAQKIRDLVREDLERHPDTQRIHLFLAGPGGLALLLGHRWNRTRPTVVYEHLGPGHGYTPAFFANA